MRPRHRRGDGRTPAYRRSEHRELHVFYEAWPQVANEAANAFSMSGGQTRVPVVFHLFHGLRRWRCRATLWQPPSDVVELSGAGDRNSVLATDVKGLLKSAVASDNPTIFVDHTRLLDVREKSTG